MKSNYLIICSFFLLVNVVNSQGTLLTEDLNKVSSSEDYIKFYQNNISDLRSGSCPMYPSCSNYALQTIKEQGLITGIINGSDRLLRCGHEHKYYNLTLQEKGFKLIDLPNNEKETSLLFSVEHQSHTFNSFYKDSTLNLLASLINDGLYSEALIEIYKIKIEKRDLGDDLIAFEMMCLNAMKMYDKVIYNYSLLDIKSKNSTSILNGATGLDDSYYTAEFGGFKGEWANQKLNSCGIVIMAAPGNSQAYFDIDCIEVTKHLMDW